MLITNNTASLREVLNKINNLPESDYVKPTGTKTITENGTHDVTNYASAKVEVAGEDVTAETNAYTTELAELTTAVTALENELAGKAAGGGSGGSVEICTVEFRFISQCNAEIDPILAYCGYENGEIVTKTIGKSDLLSGGVDSIRTIQVVKNTCLTITCGVSCSAWLVVPQVQGVDVGVLHNSSCCACIMVDNNYDNNSVEFGVFDVL